MIFSVRIMLSWFRASLPEENFTKDSYIACAPNAGLVEGSIYVSVAWQDARVLICRIETSETLVNAQCILSKSESGPTTLKGADAGPRVRMNISIIACAC